MTASVVAVAADDLNLTWKKLPSLPDPIGFAGSFAGTSGNALIVAGGANFPGKLPWEGGTKVWYDHAYVLESPDGTWKKSFRLPFAVGYGISVSAPVGVVCIGGSDALRHLTNVFLLKWDGKQLHTKDLPPLPRALANSCGAILNQDIYVAGGTDSPDATNALHKFFHLDLSNPKRGWEELPPWPGPARMLATAAVVQGSFFLAGGTDLYPDAQGKPVRNYLKDAYRYTPGQGWKRVADMPNPVVAAPSPAPTVDDSGFLIVGGDDGSLAGFEPRSKHPGFPRRVLRYDVPSDRWFVDEKAPLSRATLPTASWRGLEVMPSGEARPGVRSPEVWALSRPGNK